MTNVTLAEAVAQLTALPAGSIIVIDEDKDNDGSVALAQKSSGYNGESFWMFIGTDFDSTNNEFASDLLERADGFQVLFTPRGGWTPPGHSRPSRLNRLRRTRRREIR